LKKLFCLIICLSIIVSSGAAFKSWQNSSFDERLEIEFPAHLTATDLEHDLSENKSYYEQNYAQPVAYNWSITCEETCSGGKNNQFLLLNIDNDSKSEKGLFYSYYASRVSDTGLNFSFQSSSITRDSQKHPTIPPNVESFHINDSLYNLNGNMIAKRPYFYKVSSTGNLNPKRVDKADLGHQYSTLQVQPYDNRYDVFTSNIAIQEKPNPGYDYCPFVLELGEWPKYVTYAYESDEGIDLIADHFVTAIYGRTDKMPANATQPMSKSLAVGGENISLVITRPKNTREENYYFITATPYYEEKEEFRQLVGVCTSSSSDLSFPNGPNAFIYSFNPATEYDDAITRLGLRADKLNNISEAELNQASIDQHIVARVNTETDSLYGNQDIGLDLKFDIKNRKLPFKNYSVSFPTKNGVTHTVLDGENSVSFNEDVYMGSKEDWKYPFNRYSATLTVDHSPYLKNNSKIRKLSNSVYELKLDYSVDKLNLLMFMPLNKIFFVVLFSIFSVSVGISRASEISRLRRSITEDLKVLGPVFFFPSLLFWWLKTPLISLPSLVAISSLILPFSKKIKMNVERFLDKRL